MCVCHQEVNGSSNRFIELGLFKPVISQQVEEDWWSNKPYIIIMCMLFTVKRRLLAACLRGACDPRLHQSIKHVYVKKKKKLNEDSPESLFSHRPEKIEWEIDVVWV